MGNKTRLVNKYNLIVVLFCVLSFFVYFLSKGEFTYFNHFSRLADSFIQGKLYVSAEAPWLEQVPIDSSHFYVPYPPMPAILLIPFSYIFKGLFPQDYLGYLLGSFSVGLAILISQVIKKDVKLSIFIGVLALFGNITWYLTSVNSSWYLGQMCGYFFLTAAIYESLTKKRRFFVGVLLGAAYLSRIELIVSLPFFIYLSRSGGLIKSAMTVFWGILPFILFNFYYNFARFGVIWDKAYTLIPGVATESWYEKGVLNLSYIPRHLKIIFLKLPEINKSFPYIHPGFDGLAIWFTTPAFIYALFANIKERVVQLAWLAIFAIGLIIFSHGTTGFAQFGYRFAVDFYPFLIFILIKGISETDIKWHHWVLLTLSVITNLWGIVLINKLNLH